MHFLYKRGLINFKGFTILWCDFIPQRCPITLAMNNNTPMMDEDRDCRSCSDARSRSQRKGLAWDKSTLRHTTASSPPTYPNSCWRRVKPFRADRELCWRAIERALAKQLRSVRCSNFCYTFQVPFDLCRLSALQEQTERALYKKKAHNVAHTPSDMCGRAKNRTKTLFVGHRNAPPFVLRNPCQSIKLSLFSIFSNS